MAMASSSRREFLKATAAVTTAIFLAWTSDRHEFLLDESGATMANGQHPVKRKFMPDARRRALDAGCRADTLSVLRYPPRVEDGAFRRAAAELDGILKQWRERPLGCIPYLILDARYEKV